MQSLKIIRTPLLELTTLVIVLTTGEMNSMCSSKMATPERMRTCLERYEDVCVCVSAIGAEVEEGGG